MTFVRHADAKTVVLALRRAAEGPTPATRCGRARRRPADPGARPVRVKRLAGVQETELARALDLARPSRHLDIPVVAERCKPRMAMLSIPAGTAGSSRRSSPSRASRPSIV